MSPFLLWMFYNLFASIYLCLVLIIQMNPELLLMIPFLISRRLKVNTTAVYWWMRRIHILFGCLVLIVFQDVEKWIFYYNKTMNRMEMKYAGVAEFTKITVITLNIKNYCQVCQTITHDHVWFWANTTWQILITFPLDGVEVATEKPIYIVNGEIWITVTCCEEIPNYSWKQSLIY